MTNSTNIEITPEMIEAGIDALYRFNISEPTRPEMDTAVEAVFRAMFLTRAYNPKQTPAMAP